MRRHRGSQRPTSAEGTSCNLLCPRFVFWDLPRQRQGPSEVRKPKQERDVYGECCGLDGKSFQLDIPFGPGSFEKGYLHCGTVSLSSSTRTAYRTISPISNVAEQTGKSLCSHKAAVTSNSARKGVVQITPRGWFREDKGIGTASWGGPPLVTLFSRMDSTMSAKICGGLEDAYQIRLVIWKVASMRSSLSNVFERLQCPEECMHILRFTQRYVHIVLLVLCR